MYRRFILLALCIIAMSLALDRDHGFDRIDVTKEYSNMLNDSWSGVRGKKLRAEDVLFLVTASKDSDFVYAFQTERSAKMWGEDKVAYVSGIPTGAHSIQCYRTYSLGSVDEEYESGAAIHADNIDLLSINNSMLELIKGSVYKTKLLKTKDGKVIGIYFKEVS